MSRLLLNLRNGDNYPTGEAVLFESSNHIRKEPNKEYPPMFFRRCVRIEKNISQEKGYTVTILNLDGNHPVWGNNIQMAPKQMEVVAVHNSYVELRGYGYDQKAILMGAPRDLASFADYGLLVHFSPNGEIERCTLLMHDRGIMIEYNI